jgi:hypothetical protein
MRPNPPLNSDPACTAFRSFSSSRFLGSAQRLGAGGAGWLHSLGLTMDKAKNAVLWLGFLSILAINLFSYLPRFHKGEQRPVGEEIVSVFPYRSDSDIRSVPVKDPNTSKPLESGERVHVYLSYAYEDGLNLWYPRLTIKLLLGLAVLYGLLCLTKKLFTRRV